MSKCHKVKIYETTNFFCDVFGALIDAKPIGARSWACAVRWREATPGPAFVRATGLRGPGSPGGPHSPGPLTGLPGQEQTVGLRGPAQLQGNPGGPRQGVSRAPHVPPPRSPPEPSSDPCPSVPSLPTPCLPSMESGVRAVGARGQGPSPGGEGGIDLSRGLQTVLQRMGCGAAPGGLRAWPRVQKALPSLTAPLHQVNQARPLWPGDGTVEVWLPPPPARRVSPGASASQEAEPTPALSPGLRLQEGTAPSRPPLRRREGPGPLGHRPGYRGLPGPRATRKALLTQTRV